jgi:hypothetical protein
VFVALAGRPIYGEVILLKKKIIAKITDMVNINTDVPGIKLREDIWKIPDEELVDEFMKIVAQVVAHNTEKRFQT